ncbi:Transposase [compost metagenome]
MEGKTSRQRFSEEFKVQAVKQVTEGGHKVGDVATRLGVSPTAFMHGSSAIRAVLNSGRIKIARAQRSVGLRLSSSG